MNITKKMFLAILFFALLCGFSTSSFAERKKLKKEPIPIKALQGGVESLEVVIDADLAGKIKSVKAKACEKCDFQVFSADKGIRFQLGNRKLNFLQALQRNGSAGSVIYDLETKLVTKISYFPKKGER